MLKVHVFFSHRRLHSMSCWLYFGAKCMCRGCQCSSKPWQRWLFCALCSNDIPCPPWLAGALGFLPSVIAAAAVLLAQFVLGYPVWSPTLAHYTHYTPGQLAPAVRLLYQALREARHSSTAAIRDKFASERYRRVSEIRVPDALPDWVFA